MESDNSRKSNQPNILVVMSDQHNKHVTGCYGDPVISTPNLDRLASRGVLFENTYCPFPLCVPARMAFMTGKTPSSIQMYDNSSILHSDEPTFAHALGQNGYETVLCGRMHFNGPDQRHGFQKRIFPEVSGYARGMLEGTSGFGRASLEKSGPGRNHYLLYDQECVTEATRWLRERIKTESNNPFCMVVGLVGPHCPFVCPQDLFDKYFETIDIPDCSEEHFRRMSAYNQRFRQRSNIHDATAHETRRTRAAYYGMVEFDDSLVGLLMSTLEETKLIENTLIVYVSDHGEMAGEHGLWWKMSFYEGSVGVPMIVSLPGRICEGVREATPVSLVDLAPTLGEIGGAPDLPGIHGRSLASYLSRQESNPDRAVFSELFIDSTIGKDQQGPSGGPGRMLRKGNWKCMYYYGEEPELYDLDVDPGERVDRSRDPECKPILDGMLNDILSNWDPEELQADMDRIIRKRTFVRAAPADARSLQGEYWKGSKGYGWVDPV